jgi:hypothetical protein
MYHIATNNFDVGEVFPEVENPAPEPDFFLDPALESCHGMAPNPPIRVQGSDSSKASPKKNLKKGRENVQEDPGSARRI